MQVSTRVGIVQFMLLPPLDASPQFQPRERGEQFKAVSPVILVARLIAATNVRHAAVVSADGHVTTAGIAVISISTMPVPPIAISVPTDARRTDAELAARKHNRFIGSAQGIRKRRKCRDTGRNQQD